MLNVMLIIGFLGMLASGTYFFYLIRQENKVSPVAGNESLESVPKNIQESAEQINTSNSPSAGNSLGIVILTNVAIYFLQFITPVHSLSFFGSQIGLNFMAALYCFLSGRPQLGRTFLLCLLWVCLIGPAIIITGCIVIVASTGALFNH